MDIGYYKQYEPIFGAWRITRLIGDGRAFHLLLGGCPFLYPFSGVGRTTWNFLIVSIVSKTGQIH